VKKVYLYIAIIVATIVLAVVAVSLFGSLLRPEITEDKQIELYVNAYEVMQSRLAEGGLLPEFDNAKLVEEAFHVGLNEGFLPRLADRLNEVYPYPVAVSHGHDRFEDPQRDSTAFIYLTGITDAKRVRIEAFINNNSYPVIMDYRLRNNTWKLENIFYAW